MAPGFSISYLNGLEPLMQDCLKILIKTINRKLAEAGGQTTLDFLLLAENVSSVRPKSIPQVKSSINRK
jgi:hypothetical protein